MFQMYYVLFLDDKIYVETWNRDIQRPLNECWPLPNGCSAFIWAETIEQAEERFKKLLK